MNGGDSDIKIKTEPGLAGVRLSSFKPPRDLTLGSNKTSNKKIFVPNLNAVRNKTRGSHGNNVSKEKIQHGKGDISSFRGSRGPVTGQNKPKFSILKSGGVFSEGVAASARHSSSRSYSSNRDNRDEPPVLPKPTIKPRESVKLDSNMEIQQIKELTNNEEELDLHAEHFGPTRLPISDECERSIKMKPDSGVDKNNLKPEIKIKSEPMDQDYNIKTIAEDLLDVKPDKKIKLEYYDPTGAQNLFQKEAPTLILMQFPDSLPGRGPEEESSYNSNSKEPQNVDCDRVQTSKVNPCTPRHLDEGQIGKIQIYKSGKIKMLIGNTLYDLALGTQACFRQDVMSVHVDDEQRSGNVINLGAIQSKITVTPDWESIFQRMEMN